MCNCSFFNATMHCHITTSVKSIIFTTGCFWAHRGKSIPEKMHYIPRAAGHLRLYRCTGSGVEMTRCARHVGPLYGCELIVNRYVSTVPPHNYRVATAAWWQWPSRKKAQTTTCFSESRIEKALKTQRPSTPHQSQHQYTYKQIRILA